MGQVEVPLPEEGFHPEVECRHQAGDFGPAVAVAHLRVAQQGHLALHSHTAAHL